MVREFKLVNEKGQEYSMMDIKNYCFLSDPSGLGLTYSTEYEQIGNTFIESLRNIEKGAIDGTVNFLKYDNYKNLVDFIENSEALKLAYKIPYESGEKEYFKDVNLQSLSKSQKQTNGILSEAIIFDCLSLWYEENTAIYDIKAVEDELRWDFKWDSRFVDYETRSLSIINSGHVEAPVLIEISGHIVNPKMELYVEGELYQTVGCNVEIYDYEKFLYGTKENDFYIQREKTDGTTESLFSLDVIDFDNDNVIRLPKGKSCELRLSADNEITNAQITVLIYYKAI